MGVFIREEYDLNLKIFGNDKLYFLIHFYNELKI